MCNQLSIAICHACMCQQFEPCLHFLMYRRINFHLNMRNTLCYPKAAWLLGLVQSRTVVSSDMFLIPHRYGIKIHSQRSQMNGQNPSFLVILVMNISIAQHQYASSNMIAAGSLIYVSLPLIVNTSRTLQRSSISQPPPLINNIHQSVEVKL